MITELKPGVTYLVTEDNIDRSLYEGGCVYWRDSLLYVREAGASYSYPKCVEESDK